MNEANSARSAHPGPMGVFVSSLAIEAPPASGLVAALQTEGIQVEHSPRPPLHGNDPQWEHWYDIRLPEAIRRCSTFVIVLDHAWDGSTWMAQEAHMALESPHVTPHLTGFFWNPMRIRPRGLVGYLRTELPVDPTEAVRVIVGSTSRRTMRCS